MPHSSGKVRERPIFCAVGASSVASKGQHTWRRKSPVEQLQNKINRGEWCDGTAAAAAYQEVVAARIVLDVIEEAILIGHRHGLEVGAVVDFGALAALAGRRSTPAVVFFQDHERIFVDAPKRNKNQNTQKKNKKKESIFPSHQFLTSHEKPFT